MFKLKIKELSLYLLVLSILSFLISCDNLAIPKKVSIKTGADYRANLGTVSTSLYDYIGKDAILEKMNDALDGKASVYEYIPSESDDVLEYLIHYPLYTISFDASDYFENLDLDNILGNSETGFNVNQSITLPEISQSLEIPEYPYSSSLSTYADETETVPDFPLNITMDSISQELPYVKSAVIGEGSVKFNLPDGWNNVIITIKDFDLTGSLTKSDGTSSYSENDFNSLSLNLAEGIITTDSENKINLECSGNITVSGLTVAQAKEFSKISASVQVKKLSSAVLDLSSLSYTLDENSADAVKLPSEMLQYVKKIAFNQYKSDNSGNSTEETLDGIGLKATVINSFPEGCNIGLEINSNLFFSGNSITPSIIGSGDTTEQSENWTTYNTLDFTSYDASSEVYVDLDISLGNDVNFTNLELGQEYTFAIKDISFIYDWDYIVVNMNSNSMSGTADLSSFDISSIFSEWSESFEDISKIQLSSLPAYFFAQKPNSSLSDIISSSSLKGQIYITYTDKDNTEQNEYLLGSDDNGSANVVFKESAVDWPDADSVSEISSLKFETDSSTDNINRLTESDSSFYIDMASIINNLSQESSGLTLNYVLELDGNSDAKIYRSVADNLNDSASTDFSIDMAAVLPLKLNITEDMNIDVRKILGEEDSNEDLFKRNSATSIDKYEKYVDAIKKVGMTYSIDLKAFSFKDSENNDSSISMTLSDSILNETMYVSGSKEEIIFDSDDIKHMLTDYPFNPDLNIKIPKGSVCVSRSGISDDEAVSADISLFISMDEDTSVEVFNLGGN